MWGTCFILCSNRIRSARCHTWLMKIWCTTSRIALQQPSNVILEHQSMPLMITTPTGCCTGGRLWRRGSGGCSWCRRHCLGRRLGACSLCEVMILSYYDKSVLQNRPCRSGDRELGVSDSGMCRRFWNHRNKFIKIPSSIGGSVVVIAEPGMTKIEVEGKRRMQTRCVLANISVLTVPDLVLL